jgi:hypothetical protein
MQSTGAGACTEGKLPGSHVVDVCLVNHGLIQSRVEDLVALCAQVRERLGPLLLATTRALCVRNTRVRRARGTHPKQAIAVAVGITFCAAVDKSEATEGWRARSVAAGSKHTEKGALDLRVVLPHLVLDAVPLTIDENEALCTQTQLVVATLRQASD